MELRKRLTIFLKVTTIAVNISNGSNSLGTYLLDLFGHSWCERIIFPTFVTQAQRFPYLINK